MAVKTVKYTLNGTTYDLVYNSTTKKYEATITAPQDTSWFENNHKYGGTVEVESVAGNKTTINESHSTLGANLLLRVLEKTDPVSAVTYPTAAALITNNKPVIKWTVTDTGSGVNPDTIGITIDSGTKITGSAIIKTAIANGYSCQYTPTSALADGSHTIKVDATDNDGNVAVQKSVTFKVDTVAPTLNITSPANNLITNQSSCTVSGTTNDVTSSPVEVKIKLNNGAEQEVTVQSNGSFSKTLTLVEGVNTIVITATDAAGKTTTVIRTVTLDTKAPTIKSITLTPNPVDAGKTFVISVEIED